MNISCCGVRCDACPQYPQPCPGCEALRGKPSWLADVGLDCCPFYSCCVLERKLPDCGRCSAVPCRLFDSLKDPSLSDEAFQKDLADRITRLKANRRGYEDE